MRHQTSTRRAVLLLGAIAMSLTLGACAAPTPPSQPSQPTAENPTPAAQTCAQARPTRSADEPVVTAVASMIACVPPAEPAPAMTEGPYFKQGSPVRQSLLEPTTAGEKLVLSGNVLSTDCEPIPNALLDFWQADGNGVYDNSGYGLRGHQFTDEAGRYELTTVVPGLYPGRTEHIHVKVQTPDGTELTTQLFFPDVSGNRSDSIFDERLVIDMQPSQDGWVGSFTFIVAAE